jgi:sulfide dehydrogenase cytochrome subunit
MSKTIGRAALLLAGGLVLGSSAAWAADRSEMLSFTCVGCHGPNGSSVGPATPNIAELEKETFMDIMKGYQKADRPSTIMTRIAKGYTDEELEAMAGYFSKQKIMRHAQLHDAEKAKRGAKYHDKYCDKCHEDGGQKDEDGCGILAGQWLPYLQFQLEDYHTGKRKMSKKMKKRMKKMVKEQGEGAYDDVAHYYASQK